MTLLLDTNVIIWMTGRRSRLRPGVVSALADTRNELVVSTASLVEIAAKVARGRLSFNDEILADLSSRVRFLPVSRNHAWRVSTLPMLHQDPFDRVIVAQAMIEGLTLVTGDHLLADYSVPVLLT